VAPDAPDIYIDTLIFNPQTDVDDIKIVFGEKGDEDIDDFAFVLPYLTFAIQELGKENINELTEVKVTNFLIKHLQTSLEKAGIDKAQINQIINSISVKTSGKNKYEVKYNQHSIEFTPL